jgi:adenylate kinase family enzyme
MNKTFHDYEYEIIRDREIELASFLKNLCENNYLPFKEYLGEMVPRVAGLPIYNAGNSTALYYIYCRADFMLAQVKYHLNKFPVLVSEDTFETFSIICRILSITAEACTGPCVKNQLAVYKFRTDAIVGVLRRMIDDCDSSIYHAKTMAIEYMISLMDGGNETVILHFGRNMTFSQLFDLIIDHCKRLFIHIKFIRNKKRFIEMAAEARKHKLQKEKKETDLNVNLGESKKKTGEDFDYYTYLHRVRTLDAEGASDRNLPTTNTKEEEESNDAKVDRRSFWYEEKNGQRPRRFL